MNKIAFGLIVLIFLSVNLISTVKEELPVKNPEIKGYKEIPEGMETRRLRYINNYFTLKQIYGVIKDGKKSGMSVDFSLIEEYLCGAKVEADKIFGRTFIGPYPMESEEVEYTYKRFRKRGSIKHGKGFLNLNSLFLKSINSENWKDKGQVIIRFELYLDKKGRDISLGVYDIFLRFIIENEKFYILNTITEGPSVNLLSSNKPTEIVIAFETSKAVEASVYVKKKSTEEIFKESRKTIKHEIRITDLKPNTDYEYGIIIDDYKSRAYAFKTAPEKGKGKIVFTYSGDCRAGVGNGDYSYLGVNFRTMERLSNLAYRMGAELFILGGDFINGNTASVDDFRTQFKGWKQAMSGFWNHRPVYTCMGNHESLLKDFIKSGAKNNLFLLRMDRWPYSTDSAEAVFEDEFVYPRNGPKRVDNRRPTYMENVYSFQYGTVKFIVFNNNYWVAKGRSPKGKVPEAFGGSPEGYIMQDQMKWIKKELENAEKDKTVKFIILFAQEPVFPNGGHIGDSMWYRGNNNVRAYYTDRKTGKLTGEKKGIVEVRNEFVRLVGNNKKVAAVLGSDEHAFHKVLIDKTVPIGNMDTDDLDGDGRICEKGEPCSPLKDLKYPVWYMVSGGGGAPYYASGKTPWNEYWKKKKNKSEGSMRKNFYYSSQENMILFTADKNKISAVIINPYGDIIDKIEDLMAVKR